ncbi:DUF5610 domain-containing protein [Aliagarivorans marinus]|uniref:DUF5610 domain-containing protein n=1 Tax=Aliagarivorans marinus TaxID=561965 RepID=UPI0003FFF123|nr:DUF5610 domain-containing protein [Aliagarivorans marinus]
MNKVDGLANSHLRQYAEQLLQQHRGSAANKLAGPAQDKAELHQRGTIATHVVLSSVEKYSMALNPAKPVEMPKPENTSLFDAEEVANNVLSFVAGALFGAKQEGADDDTLLEMMNQARKGVDMGFDSAREELSDAGLLDEELEQGISSAYDLIQKGLDDLEANDFERPQASALGGLTGIGMSQSQAGSLELETREGDKVSISFNYGRASSWEVGSNEQGNYLVGSMSQSQSISFSVEGDLNEDELAAIADLIKQVDEVGAQFFNGNLDQAFNQALEIGFDQEQLVGFAVEYTQQTSVSATAAYQPQSQGGTPAGNQLVPELSQFIDQWQQVQDRVRNLFAEPNIAQQGLLEQILPLTAAGLQPAEESDDQEAGESAPAQANPVERFTSFTSVLEQVLANLPEQNRDQSVE